MVSLEGRRCLGVLEQLGLCEDRTHTVLQGPAEQPPSCIAHRLLGMIINLGRDKSLVHLAASTTLPVK